MKKVLVVIGIWLTGVAVWAESITTIDGVTYNDISGLKLAPDNISFSCAGNSVTLDFLRLPPELRTQYGFDPFLAGIFRARPRQVCTLRLESAYRLAELEEAKARARVEGKPLGFIMAWDQFFGKPWDNHQAAGASAALHFYLAFRQSCVLIMVRHEDELPKIPEAVKLGFFGPDEGGWSPNLCVVDAEAKDYICEIPLGGGGKHSTTELREKAFMAGAEKIRAYYKNRAASAPPADLSAPVAGGEPLKSCFNCAGLGVTRCRICSATGEATCAKCKGAGTEFCDICEGRKQVPQSWSASNNPKSKIKLVTLQLKDGRSVCGQVTMANGCFQVKTEKGETVIVRMDEIGDAPKPAGRK